MPKPDKSYRFRTDFRKVNSATKSDTYPIPRIVDCIDHIVNVVYISKFDLLKGYWHISLTDRAKEISAFTIPGGLYQYQAMAFGLKNAPGSFERLMHEVNYDLPNTNVYIDDVIVFSDNWKDHMIFVHNDGLKQ